MKSALLDQVKENQNILESKETAISISKFIKEETTYEQLLNLTFNPNHKIKYLDSSILENQAINLSNSLIKEPKKLNSQEKFRLLENIVLNESDYMSIIDLEIELEKVSTQFGEIKNKLTNTSISPDKRFDLLNKKAEIADKLQDIRSEWSVKFHKLYDTSETLDNIKDAGIVIAAGIALTTASYFIYKRFFSMKAKACKNAENRKECLKKIKWGGAKEAIKALEKGKSNCGKNKNPDKCKSKFDKQIAKWKKKVA